MTNCISPYVFHEEMYHLMDSDYVIRELELMKNDDACLLIKNMAVVKDINNIQLDNLEKYLNLPQENEIYFEEKDLGFSIINEKNGVKWGVLGTFNNISDFISEMDYKGYLDLVIKYEKEIYFSIYNKNSIVGCIKRMEISQFIYEYNFLLLNVISKEAIDELVFSRLNTLFDYKNGKWKSDHLFIEY